MAGSVLVVLTVTGFTGRISDLSKTTVSTNVEFDMFLNGLPRNVVFIVLKYYVLSAHKCQVTPKTSATENKKWEE